MIVTICGVLLIVGRIGALSLQRGRQSTHRDPNVPLTGQMNEHLLIIVTSDRYVCGKEVEA